MRDELTLVILAAGIGRRFGGLKQLAAVGPHGEAILDYTMFDAMRAGFGRVVFVIRPDLEEAMRAVVAERFGARLPIAYAHQRLDQLPPGAPQVEREKPWGTGHAVLAAADHVAGPLSVVNADDFYGADAIGAVAAFLRDERDDYALVAYRMGDTLPPAAPTSRALCRVRDGYLERIEELTHLQRDPDGDGVVSRVDGVERRFTGDEPVSMNLWAFQPDIFTHLREGFAAFLRDAANLQRAEYFLPTCVGELIESGRKRVRVLPAGASRWAGITHPEDRDEVVRRIRALIDAGVYPEKLWA